ncbi:DUF605-domain-containing protein [Lyophyllum atratum]|nr:DUF605-domain-containing protein [Lyophyllum atratum]
MASQSLLGLPPVSQALKSISPYLQRAHELQKQDPVIAYWCAYHAAQLGISLKAKDSPSRDVLFALLGVLERFKKEIGPNDALDIESVSAAYVENFALKVFAMADDEDRTASATRSTAKKFLAAANFLEVLKIFPKAEISDSTEEKIRYAKWKAADIAKAFREGRKPTPGPANSAEEEDRDATPPASPFPPTKTSPIDNGPPSRGTGFGSDKSVKRASPPNHIEVPLATQPPFASQPQTPPRHNFGVGSHGREGWGGEGEATPESWSTAATPGTAQEFSVDWEQQPSPTSKKGHKPRSSSGSGGVLRKNAWVNGELEPHDGDEYYALHQNGGIPPGSAGTTHSDDSSKKSVHFTPSVDGGLSDSSVASSSAPTSPSHDGRLYDDGDGAHWPVNGSMPTTYGDAATHGGIDLSILPPGFVPDAHQGWATGAGAPPTHIPPPSMQNDDPYYSSPHASAPQLPPTHHSIYTPSAPPPPQHYAPPSPPPAFDLTPTIVAKAQKHCRFAISALDYEDAEQARKELRNALMILGGDHDCLHR